MNENREIIIKLEDGTEQTVSVYQLARAIKEEQFSELLQDWLNNFNGDYTKGERLGKLLHRAHRTLQGCAYRWCLGILVAIGEQEHYDARNEVAVKNGMKIKEMLKDGTLEKGWMI